MSTLWKLVIDQSCSAFDYCSLFLLIVSTEVLGRELAAKFCAGWSTGGLRGLAGGSAGGGRRKAHTVSRLRAFRGAGRAPRRLFVPVPGEEVDNIHVETRSVGILRFYVQATVEMVTLVMRMRNLACVWRGTGSSASYHGCLPRLSLSADAYITWSFGFHGI